MRAQPSSRDVFSKLKARKPSAASLGGHNLVVVLPRQYLWLGPCSVEELCRWPLSQVEAITTLGPVPGHSLRAHRLSKHFGLGEICHSDHSGTANGERGIYFIHEVAVAKGLAKQGELACHRACDVSTVAQNVIVLEYRICFLF